MHHLDKSIMSETLTRAAFARHLGRSKSYITKLGSEGRLVLTDDGKRVKVAESIALIEATAGQRDDVAARHAEERTTTPEQHVDPSMEQAKRLKAVSEARRMAASADKEEMERDKLAGSLIAREDVDFVLNDFGATLTTHLENLADQLAPVIYPLTNLEETHAAIAEAVLHLQQSLAETMRRRVASMGGSNA
jgi:hypothetical protein